MVEESSHPQPGSLDDALQTEQRQMCQHILAAGIF